MFAKILLSVLCLVFLGGCVTSETSYSSGGNRFSSESLVTLDQDVEAPEQMLIWTGNIAVDVVSISNATCEITQSLKEMGGYVESTERRNNYRPSATLKLRIPASKLTTMLTAASGVGEVTEQTLSSRDVMEMYIDTSARFQTKEKLRDRLEALLARAVDVKEVLAIEKELSRIQADLDSMAALLKAMKGKVDYASLTVVLNAKRKDEVLGPLGLVWEGAGWCISKLFVWKEAVYSDQ